MLSTPMARIACGPLACAVEACPTGEATGFTPLLDGCSLYPRGFDSRRDKPPLLEGKGTRASREICECRSRRGMDGEGHGRPVIEGRAGRIAPVGGLTWSASAT